MSDKPVTAAVVRRRLLMGVALMVATLVLVPTLVRATQPFERAAASPTLRLNRGFDGPVAKCRVEPPAASLAQVPAAESSMLAVTQLTVSVDAPLRTQSEAPPRALRGPPLPSANS